jgi:hypothetical protein
MAAADNNVLPGRRGRGGRARGERRCVLARLLLQLLRHAQLDRKLLPLLAALLMPACIIPVAPEFQDPAGVPNSPPFIIQEETSPPFGAEVVDPTFAITISDPNVGDDLHVRWLADYPGPATRTIEADHLYIARKDGLPLRQRVPVTVDCSLYQLSPDLDRHQIIAVVADRLFADPSPNSLTLVTQDSEPAFAFWNWSVKCPR